MNGTQARLAGPISALSVGATIEVPASAVRAAYHAAYVRSIKLVIAGHQRGRVLLQRVLETRFGAKKERLSTLNIGESLLEADLTKRDCWLSSARCLGIGIHTHKTPSGLLITRTR